MAKPHLELAIPAIKNGPVTRGRPPKRRRNSEVRVREYLTGAEVDRLIAAAGKNRHGHRDATLILIAFRHGLRPVEAVGLRWDAIDFDRGEIHIARVKRGSAATHPLAGRELRALRQLQREQEPKSSFVFTSERGAPFATGGFQDFGRASRKSDWMRLSGPPSHAPACVRLRACQSRAFDSRGAGVSRSSQYPTHRQVH